MDRDRAPSMIDVAREAGVALVTVSRVLNDSPAVRSETRERVEEAVRRLGYRRNDAARVLKRGRSMTIGVLLTGSGLYEIGRIMLGMELAARDAGYWLNIVSWQGADGREPVLAGVRRLAEQRVEGVVVVADRSALADLESLDIGVPVSLIMSGDIENPSIGSVEVDQAVGARLAMRHLLDHGHVDIAHISGPHEAYDARVRRAVWRDELLARGLAPSIEREGDFTAAGGYRLMLELLGEQTPPTAVFAGNDQMALGALAACAARGVSVPASVSVVGFDDIAGSAYFTPSLTTVKQDHLELGTQAVRILLGMVDGEEPRHHLIDPALIERGSTGPAPLTRSR